MITPGITNRIETMVTKDNIAGAVGSGTIEVFATPQMINMMEMCCCLSVDEFMEEGCTTVGSNVNDPTLAQLPSA